MTEQTTITRSQLSKGRVVEFDQDNGTFIGEVDSIKADKVLIWVPCAVTRRNPMGGWLHGVHNKEIDNGGLRTPSRAKQGEI